MLLYILTPVLLYVLYKFAYCRPVACSRSTLRPSCRTPALSIIIHYLRESRTVPCLLWAAPACAVPPGALGVVTPTSRSLKKKISVRSLKKIIKNHRKIKKKQKNSRKISKNLRHHFLKITQKKPEKLDVRLNL